MCRCVQCMYMLKCKGNVCMYVRSDMYSVLRNMSVLA